MKTVDIKKEGLDYLQQKAVENAIRENKAFGLPYIIVENGELLKVHTDGTKIKIGKSKYGTVKVQKRIFKLKK